MLMARLETCLWIASTLDYWLANLFGLVAHLSIESGYRFGGQGDWSDNMKRRAYSSVGRSINCIFGELIVLIG